MGVLLLFNGGLMLISALISFVYQDGVTFEITLASFVVLSLGALLMLFGRHYEKQIHIWAKQYKLSETENIEDMNYLIK